MLHVLAMVHAAFCMPSNDSVERGQGELSFHLILYVYKYICYISLEPVQVPETWTVPTEIGSQWPKSLIMSMWTLWFENEAAAKQNCSEDTSANSRFLPRNGTCHLGLQWKRWHLRGSQAHPRSLCQDCKCKVGSAWERLDTQNRLSPLAKGMMEQEGCGRSIIKFWSLCPEECTGLGKVEAFA